MTFPIPGAFPPRADKWEDQSVSSPDGSIDLCVHRIRGADIPRGAQCFITDAAGCIWIIGDNSNNLIQLDEKAGCKRLLVRLCPAQLPPGQFKAHFRLKFAGEESAWREKPFRIMDSPFNAHQRNRAPVDPTGASEAEFLTSTGDIDWLYWG